MVGACDLYIKKPNDILNGQLWDFSVCGKLVNPYFSFSNVMIRQINNSVRLTNDSSLSESGIPLHDEVQLYMYQGDHLVKIFFTGKSLNTLIDNKLPISKFLPSDLSKGVYTVCFAIPSCVEGFPSLNSEKMVIRIP